MFPPCENHVCVPLLAWPAVRPSFDKLCGCVWQSSAFVLWLVASNAAPADEALFRAKVAPILERHCVSCHDDGQRKGGLSLESAASLQRGGDSGEALSAGDADASLLVAMIEGEKPDMPKDGQPLAKEEVAAIRQWIQDGAKWPTDLRLSDRSQVDTDWWSLKPLAGSPPPAVAGDHQAPTPVDAFILQTLSQHRLEPSVEADRRTLIRRLYFDLLGLPPDPEKVEQFAADPHPAAYERLVDELLASPRYGERWARHWLDVVHYGDTHGYDKDKPRPNAWPYRDYVIRSFNEDKPYERFVREQLAGDVLWPDSADGIVATGFIAAGPWDFIGHAEVPESKIDGKIARHLDRDDMVTTTMNTFVSMTVQCAQCHNHKFDPVSQEHYYSLQSIFAALDRADRPFETDAAIGTKRHEYLAEQKALSAERASLEANIRKLAGSELAALDVEIAELRKAEAAASKSLENPAYGYHSEIMSSPDHAKWVQVDLGMSQAIERIEFVGCWDAFGNIFHGFGFPPRYKIELSDDPEFKSGVLTVLDHSQADVKNPGTTPQMVSASGQTARYVRFTATKLAPRTSDYIFALGELLVFDPSGRNIAAGKPVSALDSIEAPPRWNRSNLVDGYYYGRKEAPSTSSRLTETLAKRQALWDKSLDDATRVRLEQLAVALAHTEMELAKLPPPGVVYCGCVHSGSAPFLGTGANGGKPREIRVLNRGNVQDPRDEVGPGVPPIVPGIDWRFSLPADHPEGARRVALADWIVRPDNPLTWRSIVNRVWQYHFGRGIVDSPNDFGRMGQVPTHPELLDWLAEQFRDSGQSMKQLHRTIVCSAAYRQTSAPDRAAGNDPSSIDAENRYLWRMNRRKLEAEAIRDATLAVAGKLDVTMYGPAFQDFVIERPEHSPHYEYHKHDPNDPATHRRSIYRFLVRSQPQPFMNTLDCADPSQLVDKRNETLTALQALSLLNNPFMVAMSQHFAVRLEAEHPSDPPRQVERAFQLTLGRRPSAEERAATVSYIAQYGLPNACRLILNLNEFAFVD